MEETIPGRWHRGRFYPIMAGAEELESEAATTTEAPEPSGPWARELSTQFEDPTVRAQVDEFMRTTYQPYVTGLETRAAELEQAASFVNDLRENPVETYLELSRLLGGEDLATQVQELLTPAEQAAVAEQVQETGQLDPRVQELLDERENEKALQEYEGKIAALDVDPEIFHPLVISHEGNIEAAYGAYPAYLEQVRKAIGVETAPSTEAAVPAPNVIGSDARASSTPPLEEKPKSMDDALDLFFAEQAPQTVGSV
jgi:hypothetical protein